MVLRGLVVAHRLGLSMLFAYGVSDLSAAMWSRVGWIWYAMVECSIYVRRKAIQSCTWMMM